MISPTKVQPLSLTISIPDPEPIVKMVESAQQQKSELELLQEKKTRALDMLAALETYYHRAGEHEKAARVADCGGFLVFRTYFDRDTGIVDNTRLQRANFCKHPLCPLCAWRAHMKNSKIIGRATRQVAAIEGVDIYHLTLTVQNVPAGELTRGKMLELRRQATDFVRRHRGWSDYYLSVEVTWNGSTWHPHWHILVAAPASLVIDKKYIRELRADWGTYSGSPLGWYNATMYRATSPESAAQELTKYICKPPKRSKRNPNPMPQARLEELATAIHGLRRYSSGGEYKKAVQRAKAELAAEEWQNADRLSAFDYIDQIYNWLEGTYKANE